MCKSPQVRVLGSREGPEGQDGEQQESWAGAGLGRALQGTWESGIFILKARRKHSPMNFKPDTLTIRYQTLSHTLHLSHLLIQNLTIALWNKNYTFYLYLIDVEMNTQKDYKNCPNSLGQ